MKVNINFDQHDLLVVANPAHVQAAIGYFVLWSNGRHDEIEICQDVHYPGHLIASYFQDGNLAFQIGGVPGQEGYSFHS